MMDKFDKEKAKTVLHRVPVQVAGMSTAYAAALSWLERRYPGIKPDHVWAEVAGGVLLSLLPVAFEARRVRQEQTATTEESVSWQTYETTVWCSFFASGTPIILWQIGEAVVRHMELLRYTANRYGRSHDSNANHATALACGGGEREGTGSPGSSRSNALSTGGSGED
jgi:hypothetical protein